MSTAVESEIEWSKWEDSACYMQGNETIAAQMAAQRRAAPVYWYESPNLTTGVWVLSKWHHSRFVESQPELFSIELGFQIGDATHPEVVVPHLPEWIREEVSKPGLTHAQVRGLIARGKLSLGDPNFVNMVLRRATAGEDRQRDRGDAALLPRRLGALQVPEAGPRDRRPHDPQGRLRDGCVRECQPR